MGFQTSSTVPLGALGRILGLVLGVVGLLALGTWFGTALGGAGRGPRLDPDARPRDVEPRGPLFAAELDAVDLFRRVAPSVVHIDTAVVELGRGGFFDLQRITGPEAFSGAGSGFVWDAEGRIVTNHHVVDDAATCLVTLADGSQWRAIVAGSAPAYDLAVLQIDAPADRLQPIPVGESGDLAVGQKVFAIGNPFGLDQSLSAGIVSALDRMIRAPDGSVIDGLVQTDAAINPGNSGGPLLDSAGRLIGVNTALVSPTGVYSGIGFAVPVDTVNRIVPKILADGFAPRPGLGVRLLDESRRNQIGVDGAVVWMVLTGSPADRAGLQPTVYDEDGLRRLGDRIVSVEGTLVRSNSELQAVLSRFDVGATVELGVVRGNRTLEVPVELGALSAAPPR